MSRPLPDRLPEVLSHAVGANDEVVLDLHVPAALEHFAGHFPGLPLLPGVVQIDWAVHFARQYLPLTGHLLSMQHLKFQSVIQPGMHVKLSIAWDSATGQMKFSYTNQDGDIYSSARLSFGTRTGAAT